MRELGKMPNYNATDDYTLDTDGFYYQSGIFLLYFSNKSFENKRNVK